MTDKTLGLDEGQLAEALARMASECGRTSEKGEGERPFVALLTHYAAKGSKEGCTCGRLFYAATPAEAEAKAVAFGLHEEPRCQVAGMLSSVIAVRLGFSLILSCMDAEPNLAGTAIAILAVKDLIKG